MSTNKKNYRKITVADMSPHVHDFQPNENKVKKIFDWLVNWITLSLECGKIQPKDLLPLKSDLACHIGVSQGTIQNAFRLLEDAGYVESKQRIGTLIKDLKKDAQVKKLTSKHELAIEMLKKYIIENKYNVGEALTSGRKIAQELNISNTTLRNAINSLVSQNILIKKNTSFIINSTVFEIKKIETKTLVEKTAEALKLYIANHIQENKKLPSNSKLTKIFNVSAKTIHDAVKILAKDGILYSRRGQYGTLLIDEENDIESNLYFYEKYAQKIKQYIIESCQIGDKLPTIKDFSKKYNTSEKTIKKALDSLAEEGYIAFSRGRYGGTFLLDMPQDSKEAYKWLAINSDYVIN